MIPPNPNSVYATNSKGQADVLAAWLQQNEIDARVNSNTSLGGLPELILWSNTQTASAAFEVWVPEQSVELARELIAAFNEERQLENNERLTKGPVEARCESCGHESTFVAEKRGSVEVCPNCRSYLDVPA